MDSNQLKDNKFVIAVYVENKSGVLTRVTSMFTRRGFNIDALTVGETEIPEYSRITICMSGDDAIKRELMLIKVKNEVNNRADIMTAVDVFRASVIDYSPDEMCIEVTGSPSKIDAFVKLMQPFGILEMCRTGIVALDRGASTLFSK